MKNLHPAFRQFMSTKAFSFLKMVLSYLAIAFVGWHFSGALAADTAAGGSATLDHLVGTDVTSKGCGVINSISNALVVKVICMGIIAWGIMVWIATRKDGVKQIITGIVGFLIISKFNSIVSVFGMSCA